MTAPAPCRYRHPKNNVTSSGGLVPIETGPTSVLGSF